MASQRQPASQRAGPTVRGLSCRRGENVRRGRDIRKRVTRYRPTFQHLARYLAPGRRFANVVRQS